MSEDTQANPLTDYGRSKLEGETITREYADRLPITIIRPPAVYGPRDTDILLFFQCVKKGILPIIGNPYRQLSLVYVKDLVRGIHTAAVSERAVGETYFLTDGAVHSWWEVAQAIAQSLDKRPFRLHVPFFLLDIIAHFTEVLAKFRDEPSTLNRQKVIDLKQQHWIATIPRRQGILAIAPNFRLKRVLGKPPVGIRKRDGSDAMLHSIFIYTL